MVISDSDPGNGPLIHTCLGSSIDEQISYFYDMKVDVVKREKHIRIDSVDPETRNKEKYLNLPDQSYST